MKRFRETRAAEYGATAAAILAAAIPGCDDEGKETTVTSPEFRGVPCQLRDAMGDADCDGAIDPDSQESTVDSPTAPGDAPLAEGQTDWETELELQIGAADQDAIQALLHDYRESQEEYERFQESQDADRDGIPDYQDSQPDLHWNNDRDRDGVYNHDDDFPLDDGRD